MYHNADTVHYTMKKGAMPTDEQLKRNSLYYDTNNEGEQLYMCGADYRGLSFDGMALPNVFARESDFRGASFRGCDLRDANFKGSDLTGADFTGANVTGAQFRWCCLNNSVFAKAIGLDLTGAEAQDGIVL